MKVFSSIAELQADLTESRIRKQTIGFVPTMGALHDGHALLLRQSTMENPITVLSIFVNPTQFGPNEDLSRYPRSLAADLEVARAAGVTHVFTPTEKEIYPTQDWRTYIDVEGLTDTLCGFFRPDHFKGVATVVFRLFSIVQPTVAYFGQKDLQQCLVIQKMVADLQLPLRVQICPTVREADGLAMSSRNRYLSPEEREQARAISQALKAAQAAHAGGERNVQQLRAAAQAVLATVPSFELQYAEIRSLPNLEDIDLVSGGAALFIAGFLGKTRLIDNCIFP